MTGRVHDMIIDPKQTGMLGEVVAEGGYYGMQTFDQHLLEHLNAGRITMEDATRAASSPHDFKLMVAAQARISPRSHPNKGEGQIAGAPAETRAGRARAHRRSAGGSRPGSPGRRAGPGGSPGRASGGSAGGASAPPPPAATQPPLPPAAPPAPSGAPPTPSAPPPGIPS